MTLEELQAMSADDLKMDNLELGDESLKSAQLHQKYLTIYNNFRQLVLMNEVLIMYSNVRSGNTMVVKHHQKSIVTILLTIKF